ncbi:nuclease [Staphylococcus phage vB_SauM-HM01]|nr:nuclease [Staphylococcus phage vB_SauM-HM01]
MKIKREVSFIELIYMYYKGDIGEGNYYSTNREVVIRIQTDNIMFYDILSDNRVGIIPNDIKFIVEADIDVNTELFSIVTTFKNGSRVLNSVWYNINIDEVVSTYEIKKLELLSISTVVDDELVTIWKDGNVL